MNTVFEHGTFHNQLQTLCSFFLKIQLILVQLLAYKARSECSAAGSVARTDACTPSKEMCQADYKYVQKIVH